MGMTASGGAMYDGTTVTTEEHAYNAKPKKKKNNNEGEKSRWRNQP